MVLGLPLVGSQLAQVLVGTTDVLMMGWYDLRDLAALVLSTNMFFFVFLFGLGFSGAVMPLVAAAHEAGDERQVRRVTRMGLWLSIGAALAFFPMFWFSEGVLIALGQEPDLAARASEYLRIAGFGMFPALGVALMRAYLSALERTSVQFWIILGGTVVNVTLNYILIFGRFGAPELGLVGAALATLIAQSLTFVVVTIYALRVNPEAELFARIWRPDWEALVQVGRMGLQIALTTVAEVGLFNFSAIMMGWVGATALAAHGIALQIATITFMVHVGLAQAATVRAGRAMGRGDSIGLRDGALSVWALGQVFAFVAVAVFLGLPDLLIGAFVDPDDPLRGDILAVGRMLLAMAALFQIADSAQVVGISILRGMQDTRRPLFIAVFSYWGVGAPVSYALGIALGGGAMGIWTGLVLGLVVASVGMVLRFRTLMRSA